jgi:BASS family bile acid:Na+ symporter
VSARTHFARLFKNTGFVLALSVVIGLALYQGASWMKPAVTPILAWIMTVSLLRVPPRLFKDFKKLLLPISLSLVLNYVVLTGTLIGLSSLIVLENQLWIGFVLLAAMPAAVAVIPFSYHLGGNINLSLVGTTATYFAALVITPLLSTFLLGVNLIDPRRLLIILTQLIIGPLIVSQILQRTRIATHLEKIRKPTVDWGFFLVNYIVFGLNRDAFLGEPATLLRLCIIAFASTFILAHLVDLVSKFLAVDKPDRVSLVLLGTRKNYGLAAGVALTLFNSRTAMPMAVATAFAIMHFIWLTFWVKRMN